jgi:diadenosine tetraphosphate (Ap4A) HIT family hydrolase
MECEICKRIKLADRGKNPELVIKLKTGYVFLLNKKYYPGYTIFSCIKHKKELFELDLKFRNDFLIEMSVVAEAVFKVFKPKKINYELLGNAQPHLHWHIIPRFDNDLNVLEPVWNDLNKINVMNKENPSKRMIDKLKKEIERLIKK